MTAASADAKREKERKGRQMKKDIRSYGYNELKKEMEGIGEKPFRAGGFVQKTRKSKVVPRRGFQLSHNAGSVF